MKIKEGLLALAVAAVLSAPAFAQQDQARSSTDPMSGSSDTSQQTAESPAAASGSEAASSSTDSSSMQQSADAGSAMSDEQQQADASASASSSQPSEPGPSSSSTVAQSDVPPPIDQNTIRSVQQALNDQGQQLQVDGIWGEKTHQALMQFQRDKELSASGQLDPETLAALDLEEHQQTASSQ